MARGMVRAGLRTSSSEGGDAGVAGEGEEQEAGGLQHPSRRRRGVGRAERWPGARPGTRPGRGHQLCPVEPEVGADEEALQYATTAATSNPSPSRSAPRAVRAQGRPRSGAPAAHGLSRLSLSMRSSKSTPQSNTPQAVAKVALSASPRAKVPLSPETMTDQGRLAPSHVTSVLP